MPNQYVHRCVDVWVTKRDSKEPFRRTIAVSVQWRLPAQLSHKVGQKSYHNGEERWLKMEVDKFQGYKCAFGLLILVEGF